jgi:hypothetical protein
VLTFGHLDRVKAATGVDLAAAMEDRGKLAELLFKDMGRKLAEVLYELTAEQVEAAGLTPDDWAHRFDGATVERATEALLGAIADFFPRTRIGQAIREDLPGLLSEMDEQVIDHMRKGRRGRAGSAGPGPNSRVTSASTPARSPGAS